MDGVETAYRGAALQFSLRAEFIDSTVVGVSSAQRVTETLGLAAMPIPEDLWDELESLVPPSSAWLDSPGGLNDHHRSGRAAGIAVNVVIWPARRRGDVTVAAVASRSGPGDYARRHGIPRTYATYEELFADPEIDLIYNALPPSMHAETVHWLRRLFPEPPEVTAAEARLNPAGADVSIEAELAFGAMPALVPA